METGEPLVGKEGSTIWRKRGISKTEHVCSWKLTGWCICVIRKQKCKRKIGKHMTTQYQKLQTYSSNRKRQHEWLSYGGVTSLGNRPMDSVQVGKAVFVKENYTTLGIKLRTYSYPGRFGNCYSVSWVKKKMKRKTPMLEFSSFSPDLPGLYQRGEK